MRRALNFYGNAAWFTTQYLEEISLHRVKSKAGWSRFRHFLFILRAIHSLDYVSSSSQITSFFYLPHLEEINDPTLMKFAPSHLPFFAQSLKELFRI